MFYFLTHAIDSKLAGLEIAMINRLKIFKHLNEEARLVTFQYNRFQHKNIQPYNIKNNDFINMFDYYQDAMDYSDSERKENEVKNILHSIVKLFGSVKQQKIGNEINLFHQDRLVAKVILFHDNKNSVSNLQMFDDQGHIIRDDGYDTRGFLSITSYYGQRGGVSSEDVYDVQGKVVIQFLYHEQPNSNIEQTAIILNSNKTKYVFHTLVDFTAFFYDEIANKDKGAIFIADRSYLVDPGLIKMKNKVPVFEFWHNTYSSSNNQDGKFSEVMKTELSSLSNLAGYILPTKEGSRSLKNRLPSYLPVFNATVALNQGAILQVSKEYDPNKVIMIARIDRQKNIKDALQAFHLIHKKKPQAELFIYGYIYDQAYNEELQQLAQTLGIERAVHFEVYRNSQKTLYDKAAVMIMTSENEGWGMAINEALASGVPVISYDTCFGPSEIITDGEDGFIIPKGNFEKLSQKALVLLNDRNLRMQFSKNAILNMKRYDIGHVSKLWSEVIHKLKQHL